MPEGALFFEADASWSCASPACELRLFVNGPGGEPTAAGSGGTASDSVRYDLPPAGEWSASLEPQDPGVAAGLEGTVEIAITLPAAPS